MNRPASLVRVACVALVPVSTTFTPAPGTAAPCSSTTWPETVPAVDVCDRAGEARPKTTRQARATPEKLRVSPENTGRLPKSMNPLHYAETCQLLRGQRIYGCDFMGCAWQSQENCCYGTDNPVVNRNPYKPFHSAMTPPRPM